MITAIILVTIITAIFSVSNRLLPFKICPICAGVSGGWLILTAGIVFGRWSGDYKLPIAMLMGGTVVGIAFQGESKLNWVQFKFRSSGSSTLLWFWKAPVVIFGMPVAYWLLKDMGPATFVLEVIILVLLFYVFFVKPSRGVVHKDGRRVNKLEEKMKKCC